MILSSVIIYQLIRWLKLESIKAPRASILYLPPYSPGLNPIEQVFAKLKALLRRAAVLSYEMLWRTIGKLLTQISLDECQNFFENSGYIHLIVVVQT